MTVCLETDWALNAHNVLFLIRCDEVEDVREHSEKQGEEMNAAGTLSNVRRGHNYQIRYASSNPYDVDRPPYPCPDQGALVTWLRHCGIDTWSLRQAIAVLQKGGMAVLPVELSEAQLQTYFPLSVPRVSG